MSTVALSWEDAYGGSGNQRAEPREPAPTARPERHSMTEQSRQYAECREQIGAADHVRHRFGQHRMKGPDSAKKPRRHRVFEDREAQNVNQSEVDQVEKQVDRVVSRGFVPSPSTA